MTEATRTAPSLETRILNTIRRWGRGSVFSNRDFFKLGPDSSVAWCLYRLKDKGIIRMLCRGLYDYPKFSRLLGEYLAPDLHRVAEALADKYRWHIQASGNTALNYLGLSTQVPTRFLYLSDGPSRSYSIAGQTLEFKHISRREFYPGHRESELFIQATRELGTLCCAEAYLPKLRSLLTPTLRRDLTDALPYLTEDHRRCIKNILKT